MVKNATQTYQNHFRLVTMYHYVALPILLINLLYTLYTITQIQTFGSINAAALAFALLVIAFFARIFALSAQDRLIRLEERLRMQQLLPDDLKSRISDYSTKQLIALRFASDLELPVLARKVFYNNIADQKVIKQMIQEWRPDHQRV